MTDSLDGSGQCVCGHFWFDHYQEDPDGSEIEPCDMDGCSCTDFTNDEEAL